MTEINLLPQELKPRTFAINLSKILRKVVLFFLVFFSISIVIIGVSYVGVKYKENSLIKSQESLESQVKKLEETEQKLVLIRDRLKKIDKILVSQTSAAGLDSVDLIIKNLPENIIIKEIGISSEESEIVIVTDSAQNLSAFFLMLSNLNFSQIVLSSLLYDQDLGYRVDIKVIK